MKTLRTWVGLTLFSVFCLACTSSIILGQSSNPRGPALPFPESGASTAETLSKTRIQPSILSATAASCITDGADWLLTQQVGGGGFPWTVGGGVFTNTQGPTAQGMLKAYQVTGDVTYLNSAKDNGDYMVPVYPLTYTDGDPRFSTHNPLFLQNLSSASGMSIYSDFVQTWFWDKLSSGTYGETNDWDAADFGAAVVNGRTSQGIVALSPWDLSATAIAAHLAGETTSRDALMAAILDGLEATTAGDFYDVIGLTGAVWASAVTGVDLDPTAGAYASASSTTDLAAILSGMTLTADNGAFLWGSNADPTDFSNGDVQTTAYALMALYAFDASTYRSQINNGRAFIKSLQSSGQFLAYSGASSGSSGGVEVHGEALAALVMSAPFFAAGEQVQALIDDPNTPSDAIEALEEALDALEEAQAAADNGDTEELFGAMRDAADALEEAREEMDCTDAIASSLANMARDIATAKKAEALDCDPTPSGKMADDMEDGDNDLADGDEEYADGYFGDAIKDYRKAWEDYCSALERCEGGTKAALGDLESALEGALPAEFALHQNYPNPFNPSTTIQFDLAEKGHVELNIYNSAGQLVRALASGDFAPGAHKVVWDAKDDSGSRVASGVYLYTIKVGQHLTAQRKLLLMK